MPAPELRVAVEELVRFASSRLEIQAAYIFGSTASGRARPDSDIDVAFLIEPAFMSRLPRKYLAELTADTGAALKTFNIDVILLNSAPPAFAYNVITKGKLVYERSRSARVAFQVRNLNLALDLEPLHKTRVQYMKQRYLKGKIRG
jgi:predicted nucleotidyltransferase